MTEHIVAVFKTEQAAVDAARELENAGVSSSAIRKYAAPTSTTGTSTIEGAGMTPSSTTRTSSSGSGFWAWVMGEEGSTSNTTSNAYPDEDVYSRHYETGNTVLSVTLTDDSRIHETITILDAHHPLDIEESTEETGTAAAGSTVPGQESSGRTSVASTGMDYSSGASLTPADTLGAPTALAGETGVSSGYTNTATTGTGSGEQVIQLAEEQLNVGTRTVDRGTTRVRRYVVSTPVEQDVTLRGERVTIERRRPVTKTGPGAGAFEERVVEVRETEEVPVVEKTARVVEEVAIRREATERKETVRDTVRREELEVAPDKPGSAPDSGSHSAN